MENQAIDNHLKQICLLHFTFKPSPLRSVAVAVGQAFAAAPGIELWPDEIELPEIASEDRNVIGSAYKNLARWKIIQRIETQHRRSTAPGRRGGIVFRYRLLSSALLKAFLKANGGDQHPQKLEQGALPI